MAMRPILRRLTLSLLLFLLVLAIVPAVAQASMDVLIWQTGPSILVPVKDAACGQVGNKLYVIGGALTFNNSSLYQGTSIYDGSANQWSYGVNPVPARYQGAAATVGNVIYVLGGRTAGGTVTDNVFAYDTSGSGSAYSVGTLSVPRAAASACAIGNKIYVIGGQDSSGALMGDIDVFDTTGAGPGNPGTAQLQTNWGLPWPIRNSFVFAYGTSFYSFGGIGTAGKRPDGWRFDTANPTSFDNRSPMIMAHGGSGSKAALNGKVYNPSGTNGRESVEQYDISANTWNIEPSMPHDRREPYCAVLTGPTGLDELVVASGYDTSPQSVLGWTDIATIVPASSGTNNSYGGGSSPGTANISVSGGTVSVGFPGNTTSGIVNVSNVPKTSLPPLAGIGFKLAGQVYDITTNVTGWTTLTITLPYNGTNPNVTPRHWNSQTNTWDAITSPAPIVDLTNHTVTFVTSSLSPFALDDDPTPVPASSPWSLALVGAIGFGLLVAAFRRRVA